MALLARPTTTGPARPGASTRRAGRTEAGAAVALAASVAVIVGRDGSPTWQVGRVLLVAAAAALLVRTRRWRRPRALGALELVAGLGGLAVGVGIGVPHLQDRGAPLATAAGLVALVAGGVLAVGGARRLLRGASRPVAALAGSALLLTAALTTSVGGVAIAATNVPPTPLGAETPADLGLRYADVAFPTADGVELSGWYVAGTNGAAMVLRHGAGSTRTSVLGHAAVLARHGYGVLLVDARGHGASAGRAMDFGWYGDLDTSAAVDFLAARPEVDDGRIGVVGLSMGGEEAIGAAAADPRLRAVVAEGATNRVAGDKAWLSEVYGVRGAAQEVVERLVYGAADLLTAAGPPRTLRAAVGLVAPRPVLLVTAGDRPDEGHAARFIRAGAPATVEVWTVPGAGHTAGLATAPGEWEWRVTGFLDRSLGGGAGGRR